MRFARLFLLLPLLACAAVACGPSSPTPSTAPQTSSSPPASASSSATPGSNGQSAGCSTSGNSSGGSGSSVNPADLVVTTSELPQGNETWTQTTDGELGGNSASHQSAWRNADNSQGVEVDVIIESSAGAAANDWAQFCNTVQEKVLSSSGVACPSQAPTPCAENVGKAANGNSEIAITWQEGFVLAAVVAVDGSGDVDQDYANSVAANEDGKIKQATS